MTEATAPEPGDSVTVTVAGKTETFVASEPAPAKTDAEKRSQAALIYAVWRNTNLRMLQPGEYAKVEAVSGALIAAIAAAL